MRIFSFFFSFLEIKSRWRPRSAISSLNELEIWHSLLQNLDESCAGIVLGQNIDLLREIHREYMHQGHWYKDTHVVAERHSTLCSVSLAGIVFTRSANDVRAGLQ